MSAKKYKFQKPEKHIQTASDFQKDDLIIVTKQNHSVEVTGFVMRVCEVDNQYVYAYYVMHHSGILYGYSTSPEDSLYLDPTRIKKV